MALEQRLSALMRNAQSGDRRAYQSLLLEVAELVKAFARRRLRQADRVEDVAQETLLAIHRDRHTYDPERPFLPWMYAVARHRLADCVTRGRRERPGELPEELEVEAPMVEARGILRQAFALLSARQREIIELLKLEGLSVAEISLRTGLSQSSIKVTAHRGYKKLRMLLREDA